MLRVGLTGGIGAGKSTVARRLASLGAVLVDADVLAREVVEPGTPGLAAVVDRFGAGLLTPAGTLDRPALGRVVFADATARADLNAIVHPRVAARRAELAAAASPDAVVVEDVPLLVETGLTPGFHLVVVVHADAAERERRLVVERGMSPVDARARIAAQASDAERRAAADVWLDNPRRGDGPDPLPGEVDALWHGRLVPFEANVRARRQAAVPDEVHLHDPDPIWPTQAARLVARIDRATGAVSDHGGETEHIGSTAVPGLIAKDVLDLQLEVADLDEADALAPALAAAGFPRLPGEWWDTGKGDGAASWPKRLHAAADPGRPVNLHVRVTGSPGWRWALLFRDWLRADAGGRAAYEAEKRRIAGTVLTRSAYREAKEPWFGHADAEAEAWARRTDWQPPRR